MSVQTEPANNKKLAGFQAIMTSVASNREEASRFGASMTGPDGLAAYCAQKGLILTGEQPQKLFDALKHTEKEVLKAQGPEIRALEDDELDNVAGGMSWALAGFIGLGVVGALTGGVGLALAGAAFEVVGTFALGATAGGVVGGAVGAAGGGIASLISNVLS